MSRPFLTLNMAMTADGKITSAAREYPTFTSETDRITMDRLRAEADAVIVGAGTLRADDPPLHVRDAAMRAYRRSLGKPDGLWTVLVTARAEIDPASRFFTPHPGVAGRVIATVEDAPADRLRALEGRATIWRLGRGAVDLTALLDRLGDLGIRRALLEGGGETNWGFVAAGLLDELNVTVAPVLLGGRDAPTLLEGAGLTMDARRTLSLADVRREGNEIFLRYTVERR